MTRRLPAAVLTEHPIRTALLKLLTEVGSVTSTEAAQKLGYSSGLCSFHLRKLAEHGLIEDAPQRIGRARPWQLRQLPPESPQDSSLFHRELEDTSYQLWMARRDQAPEQWREDDAFSAVLHLTPGELREVGEQLRRVLVGFQHRDANRPHTTPVAVLARLFPLLNEAEPAQEADS
ncbi:helix-turn-helix domain-containing protein [Kitasatospora kifunensis]|uniref:Putative ArsR family transcriptional regulator n=1 Tax=Kitasatospora kifunensis TaxID=58351 RepID=A0A7W7VXZ9_KITKI|nr:helix-turn-helix domain-containing protein [Kitasatospora kifunensis]MBB4927031.1 putative ArsR family transcriptional regulator [Kitasatospora kifunensis]